MAKIDQESAGIIMQILKLMAVSDGSTTNAESDELKAIAKDYFQTFKIPKWAQDVVDPSSLDILAHEVPNHHRELTAQLAYRVISTSREAYQFSINSKEMETFNQLCSALGLNDQSQARIMSDITNEMSESTSAWEQIKSKLFR